MKKPTPHPIAVTAATAHNERTGHDAVPKSYFVHCPTCGAIGMLHEPDPYHKARIRPWGTSDIIEPEEF